MYRVRKEAVEAAIVGGVGGADGSESAGVAAAEPDLMDNGECVLLVLLRRRRRIINVCFCLGESV